MSRQSRLQPAREAAARRRHQAASVHSRQRRRRTGCQGPRRDTSPLQCPPMVAPSSSPRTAATAATSRHPTRRRQSADRRARAQTMQEGQWRASRSPCAFPVATVSGSRADAAPREEPERRPTLLPRRTQPKPIGRVAPMTVTSSSPRPSRTRPPAPCECPRCRARAASDPSAGTRGAPDGLAEGPWGEARRNLDPARPRATTSPSHRRRQRPADRSASHRARSRTPRCRRACRRVSLAPAPAPCTPRCPATRRRRSSWRDW